MFRNNDKIRCLLDWLSEYLEQKHSTFHNFSLLMKCISLSNNIRLQNVGKIGYFQVWRTEYLVQKRYSIHILTVFMKQFSVSKETKFHILIKLNVFLFHGMDI